MYKTNGLIETHFHGAFGIDFMNCCVNDVVELSVKMLDFGTTHIYPTLMTGEISQIKKQINIIKQAKEKQPVKSAKIEGIHLEGPFINPLKKGIHQQEFILKPTIENYQKIEDEIIKIVTIAPELDEKGSLCKYLLSKNVLVQAGHTMTDDLTFCQSVTHFFNAMLPLTHKDKNIISSSLTDDKKYIEIIADGNHVIDDVLKIVFKVKPIDKIMLISDALPVTHLEKECVFAGQKVILKNGSFYNENGTLAGSGMLQCDILRRLVKQKILTFEQASYMMSESQAKYLNIINNSFVIFDDDIRPIKIEKI